ncbi:MAG: nucleoside phosphorylase [bacterium]|jgi:uridine phosphorylase
MEEKMRADRPAAASGHLYHIGVSPGELPRYVLLPGDPDRVSKVGEVWDEYSPVAAHREFRSGRGKYQRADIGIMSTGIGAPSAAIAVEELASIGCDTFIRVGSTGVIQDGINCGDLIINTGAVRFDGTTPYYAPPEYPALAHYEVVIALIEACERLGYRYHTGIGASTSSFYTGQARPGYGGFRQGWMDSLIPDLQRAKVLNFEMEAAAIFTLSALFGLRAGCICTVFANRATNEFRVVGEDRAIRAASEAVLILREWDGWKQAKGAPRFFSFTAGTERD